MRTPFQAWLRRYLVAELLGTILAATVALLSYQHSHSYAAAAAAGFVAEGIGFYGYIVSYELIANGRAYRGLPVGRRFRNILASSGSNLIVQFAPAEVIDNIFVRPLLLFYVPQHIKPYLLGFLSAKLVADALFYIIALAGFRVQQRLRRS